MPANATASGKAILAFSEPQAVRRVLSRDLRRLTDKSIVDKQVFAEELRRTRERGYAISIGEAELGMSSIAAPFFSADGVPLGAISIAGPTAGMPRGRFASLARLLREGAERVTRGLDFSVGRNIHPFVRAELPPEPPATAPETPPKRRSRA